MKKLLLLTLVLLISVASFGKTKASILLDEVKEDGSRSIATSKVNFCVESTKTIPSFGFYLIYIDTPNENPVYILNSELYESYKRRTINKGLKAYFKLENGDIVTLESIKDSNTERVGDYRYKATTDYYITQEQLEILSNNIIVKVRIEVDAGLDKIDFENKIKTDAVKILYDLIQEQLKVKKTYMSDF